MSTAPGGRDPGRAFPERGGGRLGRGDQGGADGGRCIPTAMNEPRSPITCGPRPTRLGVDRLDLVQLHCVPPAVLEDGGDLRHHGRDGGRGADAHWGASVETLAEARICMAQPGLRQLADHLQPLPAERGLGDLRRGEGTGVGIIVRLPLASGVLTGKFEKGHSFPESDHRNYNADGAAFSVGETFSGIELDKAVDALDLIRPLVPEGDEPRRFRAALDSRPRRGELGDRRGVAARPGGAQCRRLGPARRWAPRCTRSCAGSTRRRSSRWCAARSERRRPAGFGPARVGRRNSGRAVRVPGAIPARNRADSAAKFEKLVEQTPHESCEKTRQGGRKRSLRAANFVAQNRGRRDISLRKCLFLH